MNKKEKIEDRKLQLLNYFNTFKNNRCTKTTQEILDDNNIDISRRQLDRDIRSLHDQGHILIEVRTGVSVDTSTWINRLHTNRRISFTTSDNGIIRIHSGIKGCITPNYNAYDPNKEQWLISTYDHTLIRNPNYDDNNTNYNDDIPALI